MNFHYSLSQISQIIDGKIISTSSKNETEVVVNQIITDSRSWFIDKYSLFFALLGKRYDGNNFLSEMYRKNVRYFVVNRLPVALQNFENSVFILVKNTLEALQQFATFHRQNFDNQVVAVTGSNGKTILKEWLFQLLNEKFKIFRSPKSYNSQVGVPLSILQMNENVDFAIFEAGISQKNEMEFLEKIISPQIGIFTNIGDAHQENFMDKNEKIKEKLKLFKNCKVLIYCKDFEEISSEISKNSDFEKLKIFSWTTKKNIQSDFFVEKIEKKNEKTLINVNFQNKYLSIEIPFTDSGSVENALNCLAFLLCQFSISDINFDSFSQLSAVKMQMEIKPAINKCLIINDFHNADLTSLQIALDLLNRQPYARKTLILSDFSQISKGENLYRKANTMIQNYSLTRIFGIGTEILNYFNNLPNFQYWKNTQDFLTNFSPQLFDNEAVLIKGGQIFEFEKISNLLQQKNHQTVLEINLESMVENLSYFRNLLKPETKIMAMVKAFSYGNGSFEIAEMLQYQRVAYLGVAFADEGVELRKAGISLPIIVMNPEIHSFHSIIEFHLEPEIYSLNLLRQFYKTVKQCGFSTYSIHIKLDTGMKRLGFSDFEIENLVREINEMKILKVQSIFSHLAAADESRFDDFTMFQIPEFEKMSQKIIEKIGYSPLRHLLNSAGIERFTNFQYEMVRLGIGLYGISATNQDKMANISTLKTTILQIKNVRKGESIGYNRKFFAEKDMKIAIIPMGYADGLNRKLSNGVGKMLINGNFAKIVGNICMDMCILDVTEIAASEGDEVIVFGKEHSVVEIAKQLQTIPYEIFTSISQRVKRIYFQ